MSRLVSFLALSSSSASTWITESLASRKKKRVRKSVIHADADRHGVPRRSSSGSTGEVRGARGKRERERKRGPARRA